MPYQWHNDSTETTTRQIDTLTQRLDARTPLFEVPLKSGHCKEVPLKSGHCNDKEVAEVFNNYFANITDALGCSESQRKAAVKKICEEIEKEVKSRDDSSYFMQGIRFLESLTTVTKRERLLLWKFKKTDTNKDSIINKNEMAEIEKQWKAALLPCWSIVSLDCDKNKDGNVTWSEWSYCLGERRSFFPGMMGDKTATGPPEAKVTVCKPMRICLLSCTRGFERDKYGCLICKCRGLYSFFRG
eukprot:Seg3083.1 transcript_id=Seg3083.1/GoldUCD/mRNA.D3Y31 product="SPARC-related modular calcium-binding protein 1" protein_id=Seg3083.1/GoldUCD/D3Y31